MDVVNDGTTYSDVASVTLTVNAVNDRPVATNDEYTTDEDTSLTVDAAAGVIGNDTDADGDWLVRRLGAGPSSRTPRYNCDEHLGDTPAALRNRR